MSSLDDDATDTEMLFNRIAIEAARNNAPTLKATGFCLWCEEDVGVGRRFCSKDCSDDYDKYGKK